MNSTFIFNSETISSFTEMYAPLIVFDGMVLSEELPIKCHTNEQRGARREFETILCRSKNQNWPRIQSLETTPLKGTCQEWPVIEASRQSNIRSD